MLKSWFRRGLYPTESQFADLIDSFRHKDDKVSMSDVDGLPSALNGKADSSDVVAAASAAASAHAAAEAAASAAVNAQSAADEAIEAFDAIGAIDITDIYELFEESE